MEELYHKWVNGTASYEEAELLFELLAEIDVDRELPPLMEERWEQVMLESNKLYRERNNPEMVSSILNKYPVAGRGKPQIKKYRWLPYAAVFVVIMTAGFLLWNNPFRKSVVAVESFGPENETVASQGIDKAILQLADGSTINLDSLGKGKIIVKNGKPVFKKVNGEEVALFNISSAKKFNTILVPKGGTYQITLSDGTDVWINAASSITFPSVFEDDGRTVSVSGEIYFEVAKDKDRPFNIDVSEKLRVEVLGTKFNINAYDDESSVNTTVLEGSVAIKTAMKSDVLTGGEQAQTRADGSTWIEKKVDLNAVVAWKNHEFYFGEKSDFKTVMRQIARWYDVDVVYKTDVEGHIGGYVSRDAGLEKTLQAIEKAWDVKLTIERRTIIVDLIK